MIFNGLNVKIIRKKIKNIYFRIDDNGEILVTCPRLVSDFEIIKLLKKNERSLNLMYKKFLKKTENNEKVLYLGNELQFIFFNRTMIDGNKIYASSIEKANEFLEDNCLEFFQQRLNMYLSTFDNLPKFRLRIRKMKTRWGVCNKKSMTVTLNKELIHKKIYLIDYVICHELSHFKYMDHSSSFWKEVEKHYPKYKEARKELRY